MSPLSLSAKYLGVLGFTRHLRAVAYAENSRGASKFRHNRVTSQINFRTTIVGGSGACPRENFAKLHQKYANYT